MPQVVTVYRKIAGVRGDALFSCCLNSYGDCPHCSGCVRCKANTVRGVRCSRTTCRDVDYCLTHLNSQLGLEIRPSTIPGAGLGLFAARKSRHHGGVRASRQRASRRAGSREARVLMFDTGDRIVEYKGHKIRKAEFNKLYDYWVGHRKVESSGPYSIADEKSHIVIDAMCRRNAAAFANDVQGTDRDANAQLHASYGLVALAPIYAGDEILVSYGDAYWDSHQHLDVVHKARRVDHSVDRGDDDEDEKENPVGVYMKDGKRVRAKFQ